MGEVLSTIQIVHIRSANGVTIRPRLRIVTRIKIRRSPTLLRPLAKE